MITQYSHGTNTVASKDNNVIDKYKAWGAADVRADLMPNRTKLVTIFENIGHNINIACAIRSNNAFLGGSVYVVGRRQLDTRGGVGTTHYENVYHADTLEEVIDRLHGEGYRVYAVDNWEEYAPKNLMGMELPERSAFLFGSEGDGLSRESIEMCDDMIYIRQYGSVRSMNVACAASCVMYEYSRQWQRDDTSVPQMNLYERLETARGLIARD